MYVKIEVIAAFKKMQSILPSKSVEQIAHYLESESSVQVNEAKDSIRRHPDLPPLPEMVVDKTETMAVPKGKMGFIIGKGGVTIKELQKRSGAHIFKDGAGEKDGMMTLVVEGKEEAIQKAKTLIEAKVKQAEEKTDVAEATLGEQIFKSYDELMAHVKTLLETYKDTAVPDSETPMLKALLEAHPSGLDKLKAGVKHFKVGCHPEFQDSVCLFVVHSDNSSTDFSAQKCANAIFGGSRKGKRKKDEMDKEEPELEERKLVSGLVVKVQGLSSKPDFRTAKEIFKVCGNVQFVEILEDNTLLVRYEAIAAAAKAVTEIKQYEEDSVTCSLISGKEEESYWEKAWEALDAHAKSGKGKGGKGKGGKGKGGKGKGGKGKRQRH